MEPCCQVPDKSPKDKESARKLKGNPVDFRPERSVRRLRENGEAAFGAFWRFFSKKSVLC